MPFQDERTHECLQCSDASIGGSWSAERCAGLTSARSARRLPAASPCDNTHPKITLVRFWLVNIIFCPSNIILKQILKHCNIFCPRQVTQLSQHSNTGMHFEPCCKERVIFQTFWAHGTETVQVTQLRRTLASSPQSKCARCLQCFDTVDWVAGRASSL